ncbi:hypothetical protein NECAME_12900 [Necator americanus]|uniref:Tetratricopeptide repeat protein n=1 Tax=Necator americanus TaxID=51031 RepID=W2SYF5_NECAM|nr:hypothetical protein NECAME_12900 [Necator americanus]ETN74573.1 hypothetical protein NECAME_12900 [Necator americanus]
MRTPKTIIDLELFASLVDFWEDTVMDNIDDEYERFVEHLHDCTRKAKSLKTIKRCRSPKTLELMRQRGHARAAGNQELTSGVARLCREAIKEDVKERRAKVLAEAAEAGRSICYLADSQNHQQDRQYTHEQTRLIAAVNRQLGWISYRFNYPEQSDERARRLHEAEQFLQNSRKFEPINGKTYYYLGRCYGETLNKAHEAFLNYRHSIDKSEADADTWCSIGVLYHQQNQPMDALQVFSTDQSKQGQKNKLLDVVE